MANVFANLPAPAGDGTGAAVDTSGFSARKTITILGPFTATITIEVSEDNVDWAPLFSSTKSGKFCKSVAAAYMRVRVSGLVVGPAFSPNIDVAADQTVDALFGALAVPAGDGVGASLDVRLYPEVFSLVFAGTWTGSITIEISQDNVAWVPLFSTDINGLRIKEATIGYMRVRRAGVGAVPGTPTITVGAANLETAASSPIGVAGGDMTGSSFPDPIVSRPRIAFVFQPGGTPGNNVYDDWDELYAALNAARPFGVAEIWFDDVYEFPVIPDTQVYNMEGTEWHGVSEWCYLDLADAVFSGRPPMHFENLYVDASSTAVRSPWLLTTDAEFYYGNLLMIMINAYLSTSDGPLFDLSGSPFGSSLDFRMNNSYLGDGANPIVLHGDYGNTHLWLTSSEVYDDFIDETETHTYCRVIARYDGSVIWPQNNLTQPVNYGYQWNNGEKRGGPRWWCVPETGIAPATSAPPSVYVGACVRMEPNAAGRDVNLPAVLGPLYDGITDGQMIAIVNYSSVYPLFLDADGADTIDGSANGYILGPGGTAILMSDGVSDWRVIATNKQEQHVELFFNMGDAIEPTSNPATAGSRNDHKTYDFDDTSDEYLLFEGVMPSSYAGNGGGTDGTDMVIDLHWVAATAVVGDCYWRVRFERDAASQDIDSDGWGTIINNISTAAAAAGQVVKASIQVPQNQIDSIGAGEAFRIQVYRFASDPADTMAGDAQLLRVAIHDANN